MDEGVFSLGKLAVDGKAVELLLETRDVDWETPLLGVAFVACVPDVLLELLDRSVVVEAIEVLVLLGSRVLVVADASVLLELLGKSVLVEEVVSLLLLGRSVVVVTDEAFVLL